MCEITLYISAVDIDIWLFKNFCCIIESKLLLTVQIICDELMARSKNLFIDVYAVMF